MINFNFLDRASVENTEALFILRDLDQNYFPQPWDSVSWSEIFNTSAYRLIIQILEDNHVIGFLLLEISFVDSFAHLLKIIIHPTERQKGLGMCLINEGLRQLKERSIKTIFLEVEENNISAIKIYQHAGFKIIHKKKQFYSNGADALIMTLEG
jgi:ribosomal-protein-alanine N-acetyltransferase